MLNKDNFIEASFIDNERQNIEILTKSEDGKTVIPTVIPYDENNDMFKELMTIKTIDQLHEDTHNKKKEEGRLFKEEMLRIAKQDGIIGMELNGDEYFANIIDAVIKKQDDEDHLFALKIAVFENIKQINESDDVEGKKKIRQAKNKIELFRAVFDMIE
jgi:hypothetical protein